MSCVRHACCVFIYQTASTAAVRCVRAAATDYFCPRPAPPRACRLCWCRLRVCRRVNALDVVLYEHAQQLLQQRKQALAAAGKLQKLQAPPSPEVMQQQEAAAALALGLPDSIEQQQQLQQRAAGGGEGGQQPPGHSKTGGCVISDLSVCLLCVWVCTHMNRAVVVVVECAEKS